MKKIYAFVFARGGSKGVPGKNIKYLSGKPLLAYSIEVAKNIPEISKIFVSTDDKNIATVATEYGAEVIDRPSELAGDNSSEWLAWKHAIECVQDKYGEFDIFVSLPATSPLRSEDDVRECIQKLKDGTDIIITITDSCRSPWFNMVTKSTSDKISILISGEKTYTRRQDAPVAYDMTTVAYVATPRFILSSNGVFEGVVEAVNIPAERAIDIDTQLDFEIADFLMHKRLEVTKGLNA